MKFYFFIGLFFLGCYNQDISINRVEKEIDNFPLEWSSYKIENDYTLSDFWSTSQDSSLFLLLKEFSANNKDIQVLDIQSNISTLYHDLNKTDLYPQISADFAINQGEQNLSGFGFPQDILNNEEDEENQDSQNQSSTFSSSSYSSKINTSWEIDLWGRIRNNRKSDKAKMKSELYDISCLH